MLRGDAELDRRARRALGLRRSSPTEPVAGRLQPARPARDVRRRHHRRVPPLDLRRSGARCSSTSTPSSIGLTATPSKQTFGFFNQNLVMEYRHEQAVADGVNVDFDVYRIRTEITERGLDDRGRHSSPSSATAQTRAMRWEKLDEDVAYDAKALDRAVVADGPDPHRPPDLPRPPLHRDLPRPHRGAEDADLRQGRRHADDIVQHRPRGVRQGQRLRRQDHLQRRPARSPRSCSPTFRNRYNPRIAVTVDMIATGTDVKPLECVFFMRDGQEPHLLRADEGPRRARHRRHRPPGRHARRDGEGPLRDRRRRRRHRDRARRDRSRSTASRRSPLEKLLRAGRLRQSATRTSSRPSPAASPASTGSSRTDDRAELEAARRATSLSDIARGLVEAVDPDRQLAAAREASAGRARRRTQIAAAATPLARGGRRAARRRTPTLRERARRACAAATSR